MTKRELEIENAKLRGQVAALEKIIEVTRAHLPMMPSIGLLNHGGFCACYECRGVPFVTTTLTEEQSQKLITEASVHWTHEDLFRNTGCVPPPVFGGITYTMNDGHTPPLGS